MPFLRLKKVHRTQQSSAAVQIAARYGTAVERPSESGVGRPQSLSDNEVVAKSRSDAIDADIAIERKRGLGKAAFGLSKAQLETVSKGRVYMLLILGLANSGKSTFASQLRMRYDRDSVSAETQSYQTIILLSIVLSVSAVLDLLDSAGSDQDREKLASVLALEDTLRQAVHMHSRATISVRSKTLQSFALAAAAHEPKDSHHSGQELHEQSRSIPDHWRESNKDDSHSLLNKAKQVLSSAATDVAGLWTRFYAIADSNSIGQDGILSDSATYFMTNSNRILATSWTPTDEDILKIRMTTIGVQEHLLRIEDGLFYRIIDPSGARGSRQKWTKFFDGCTSVIFMVACDEFDLMDTERPRPRPRLLEALDVVAEIGSNQLLQNVPLLLFFNKTDLLRRKIKTDKKSFAEHMPDFKGESSSLDSVRGFIKLIFKSAAEAKQVHDRQRLVYTHFLSATDTRSSHLTLDTLQDIVIRTNLGIELF